MNEAIRTLTTNEFPALLREIADPPERLHVRGKLPPEEYTWLCVVGSRKYSQYGKSVCEKLIAALSGYPIVVVSGLALGMDAIAHQAALSAKLLTVAVPASGLDTSVLYPRSHEPLAREIIQNGGALVSEYENNFKATPWSFPKRNRVMAGLCHAALIIEADEKSGTLITARLANEYNRDVLIVPAPITSLHGQGSNKLLRQGATAVTCAEDILEALHISPDTKDARENNKNLSAEEKEVLELLREPLTRDELIRTLAMPISEAQILISTMELKGLVQEQLGALHKA